MKTLLMNALRRLLRFRLAEDVFARLLKNRGWDSKLIRFAPAHVLYPAGSIRHVERHGINYVLDMSDLVDWWIFMRLADPVVTVGFLAILWRCSPSAGSCWSHSTSS